MRDPWNDSELVRRFRAQSRTALPRAPLNSALCTIIAERPGLSSLLGHAPVEHHQPVLLLAAIHSLVLAEPDHPLAAWYPNVTIDHRAPDDRDLAATLVDFVAERVPAVLELLGSRRVQTNEVGRCAIFLPAFARIAAEAGPLTHIDVGSSAGLTTLLPRFAYRYDDAAPFGSGAVLIECSTRGPLEVPVKIPEVATSIGLDSSPIDVTDTASARWLEACCWPDQTDRFRRLAGAIEIARRDPPRLVRGDAVDDLASTIELAAAPGDAHPVITTSWVLNYLAVERQREFVAALDRVGAERDVTWVIAESPAQTPALPHDDALDGEHVTAVAVVRWRRGRRSVEHVGTCHPHGYWFHAV